MPSHDLAGAVVAFLDGDSGDVRTGVNAEDPGRIAAGGVFASRGRAGAGTRPLKSRPTCVELVLEAAPTPRAVGLGFVERDVVVALAVSHRAKDLSEGAAQADVLERVLTILEHRYGHRSALAVAAPAGSTFVGVSAERLELDEAPDDSLEQAGAVRTTWTFVHPRESNA